MLEDFYAWVINPVMAIKAVLVLVVALIVLKTDYFASRVKWRAGFLVSCAILFVGLAGDLLDGLSSLSELRTWAFMRHLGVTSLLFCVLGMHWQMFAPVLFKGSKLFDNPVMRKLLRYHK